MIENSIRILRCLGTRTPCGPDGSAFTVNLHQLLLLKSYPLEHSFRGPAMRVLRLSPIQTLLDKPLQIGSIKLIGYDLSATKVPAGSDVTITYYWQADAPTNIPFRVFTHIYPLDHDL